MDISKERRDQSDCLNIFPNELWTCILKFTDFDTYISLPFVSYYFYCHLFEGLVGLGGNYRTIALLLPEWSMIDLDSDLLSFFSLSFTSSILWSSLSHIFPINYLINKIKVVNSINDIKILMKFSRKEKLNIDPLYKDTGNIVEDCLSYLNMDIIRNITKDISKKLYLSKNMMMSRPIPKLYDIKNRKLQVKTVQDNQLSKIIKRLLYENHKEVHLDIYMDEYSINIESKSLTNSNT